MRSLILFIILIIILLMAGCTQSAPDTTLLELRAKAITCVCLAYATCDIDKNHQDNQAAENANAHTIALKSVEPTAVFSSPDTQRLHWTAEKDWRREADRTGKPVFFFFTKRSGCPPCELIKKNVLPDQGVIKSLNRFIYVKIEDPKRMRAWRINATPQGIFVDPKTKFVVKIGGIREFIMPTWPGSFRQTLDRGYRTVKNLRGNYENSRNLDRTTGHVSRPGHVAGSRTDDGRTFWR